MQLPSLAPLGPPWSPWATRRFFRCIVLAFPLAHSLFCHKSATDRRIDRLCIGIWDSVECRSFDVRRLIMPSHSKTRQPIFAHGGERKRWCSRREKERERERRNIKDRGRRGWRRRENTSWGGNAVTRKGMCHREPPRRATAILFLQRSFSSFLHPEEKDPERTKYCNCVIAEREESPTYVKHARKCNSVAQKYLC